MEIEGVICKNPLIAESKNITIFVHSPFLFNDVSLNQIFLKDPQKDIFISYIQKDLFQNILFKTWLIYTMKLWNYIKK